LPRVVVGVDVEEAPDAEEAPDTEDAPEASDTEDAPDAPDEELPVPVATFPMVVVLAEESPDADELGDEPLVDAELVADADPDEVEVVAAVPTDVELDEEAPEDEEADADVDELAEDDDDDDPFALPEAVVFERRVLASVNVTAGLFKVPPYTYPCAEAPGAVGSPHLRVIDLTWDVKCPPAAV